MAKQRRPNISVTWTQLEKLAMALALIGRRMAYIEARTNLTPGQIYYRLRKLNLSPIRQDYYNGIGPVAHHVEKQSVGVAMDLVLRQIQHNNKQLKGTRAA